MFWKRSFRKHCSDELLVGHLDGELSRGRDAMVRSHLKACWACRGRLLDLEEQVQAVVKALADPHFPEPDRVAEAQYKFLVWQHRFEQDFDRRPNLLTAGSSSLRISAVTVFSLLVAGICLFWQLHNPSAAETLAATRKLEREFYRTPLALHQSLRVAVTQITPAPRRHAGSIEVWAEPGGSRFSSRWIDDGGVLKYALWKPDQEREWVFNPRFAPGAVLSPGTPIAETSLAHISDQGLELEQMEAGFVRWLRSRSWRPIAFATDLSHFVDEDGVLLRAEQVRSADGAPTIRLSARRETGRVRIEMVVEVDANTFLPRRQKIRFEGAGREVELSLSVERAESLPPNQLRATVFQPDIETLPAPPAARARIAPPIGAPVPLKPAAVEEARPDAAALDIVEIEAEYALHLAGVCLGEPIEMLRDPSGYIQIRGLAATAERKAELLGALAQLGPGPWIRVDIQTLEEASAQSPPRAALTTSRTIQTAADKLPIQDELEQWFAQRLGPKDSGPRQRIADFATEAISASDQALAHGWALRRLAERYGREQTTARTPRSRRLLEQMLRDHLGALRATSDRTRQMLNPVLTLAAGESSERSVAGNAFYSTWGAGALEIFDTVKRMDGLAQGLFAGAGLSGETVDAASGELRGLLTRMDSDIRALDSRMAGEFRPEVSSLDRP
jgi:hypothetical protein